MPQQINLCTPILLKQKRYFSARAMVQALALFVFGGAALCGYWVWGLNLASDGLRQTLAMHSGELERLRLALQGSKAASAPIEVARGAELAARRAELQQRERLLAELQLGVYRPGFGHSARLQLVAQSIPAQVWVTRITADSAQLGLSGYTLEPAALNAWIDRLSASPLLQGQRLSGLKVEQRSLERPGPGAAASAAAAIGSRPVWAFELLSGAAPAAARPASGARS